LDGRFHAGRVDRCPGANVNDSEDSTATTEVGHVVYAIVRSGGRQEKVAVGDVFELNRVIGEPGSVVELPALLLVDGETVTSDAETLAAVRVTAEVVDHTQGPKIIIQKYKNKTGYKKRQGHRQPLTQVKITGIETGK
jgi:large subunit ribosomal protein L21